MQTIGARLKNARLRKALSQEDLAGVSGVPVVTISRMENAPAGRQPRPSTVRKLADALEVDPGWLLFGDDDPAGKMPAAA